MKIQIKRKQKSTPEPEVDRLGVSIEEAAKMLSVSARTIHELTLAGKLNCKRIGRRVIYSVEGLKKFLNAE